MGAAVNIAHAMHTDEWMSQGILGSGLPEFHQEGDSGDIFEELRLPLVWEVHNTTLSRPSGNHTVFLRGAPVPQPQITLSRSSQDDQSGAIMIMYDCRNAALWYDCHDSAVVRRGISLNFHINTVNEQDIELLFASDL